MEQNKESRNKHMHTQSISPGQRKQGYIMEKRQPLQHVVLRKLDSHNEIRTFSHFSHKNKLKNGLKT